MSRSGGCCDFLKEKGIYQNTVIVLSGDHGESLGEHGEKTHGFFIYNATMHVPLIIRLPGNAAARTVADPVSLVDLMPTVLGAVGLEVPSQVQGKSLLARGSRRRRPRRRPIAIASSTERPSCRGFTSTGVNCVARRTRSITSSTRPSPSSTIWRKIRERLHNLLGEKKAVAEEMRAKLVGMIRDYSAGKELAEKTGLDPALMERLKSLGYAGFSGGTARSDHQQSRLAGSERSHCRLMS